MDWMGIKKFDTRGQTLLEILIALGVGVAVLSGIVVLVFTSLSGAQFSKNQNLATQYAQQGMEVVRGIRNASWTDFSSKNGDYCLGKNQTTLTVKQSPTACDQNIDNFFSREINILWVSQRATVTVLVSWTDSKGKHQSKLISYFTKWSS